MFRVSNTKIRFDDLHRIQPVWLLTVVMKVPVTYLSVRWGGEAEEKDVVLLPSWWPKGLIVTSWKEPAFYNQQPRFWRNAKVILWCVLLFFFFFFQIEFVLPAWNWKSEVKHAHPGSLSARLSLKSPHKHVLLVFTAHVVDVGLKVFIKHLRKGTNTSKSDNSPPWMDADCFLMPLFIHNISASRV